MYTWRGGLPAAVYIMCREQLSDGHLFFIAALQDRMCLITDLNSE
jgi:hypothetical protein